MGKQSGLPAYAKDAQDIMPAQNMSSSTDKTCITLMDY